MKSPTSYRPCIQNLLADAAERDYWLTLFENHVDTLADLPVAGQRLCDDTSWPVCKGAYLNGLARLRAQPDLRGELTVLELTKYRDECLVQFGYTDPFTDLKARENAIAMQEFTQLLADLDERDERDVPELLARGLFAGNLFDMGSKAAVDAFADKDHGFFEARVRVADRPWRFDGLDAWSTRLRDNVYRKTIIFVDNAGPDIVLGIIPFARYLAIRGIDVVLAANSGPALNDVTADELRPLLDHAASFDAPLKAMLRELRIRVVASGCTSPLIDLRDLTEECCNEASDADLLVLEGMGRAIESNFDAEFTIDTIKVALIKDPTVARVIGVALFDPVFRFDAAT